MPVNVALLAQTFLYRNIPKLEMHHEQKSMITCNLHLGMLYTHEQKSAFMICQFTTKKVLIKAMYLIC